MRAPDREMLPAPRRRWSRKTQVLAVLGLSLAVVVLTVGMVGFARSIGFVTRVGVASKLLDDAAQISPDVTVGAGLSATPAAQNPSPSLGAAEPSAPEPQAPSRLAAGGNGSTVAVTDATGNAAIAGAGGSVSGAGGAAGMAGSGGEGGAAMGGVAGATPGSWEEQLQRMAVSLAQTTSTMCGPNTCNVGLVCCNWSCGVCGPPGATCDQTPCPGAARFPTAVRCGSAQCNDGQVCCNPSCSICAAPGQTCSTETCP